MCGISGIYNYEHHEAVDPALLRKMTAVLVHRRPDPQGLHLAHNLRFAHRRLSIIDLPSGGQPLFNDDNSCAIVFNGEIYNYLELRDFLISRGHKFKTNGDTEVILHLYEEKGVACVNDLRGMFAFAIWDRNAQQLLLARDRFGIKPLYYYIKHGRCIFGSEIKAILQDPSVEKELDLEALTDYLSFIYIPAPKTIFKNIRKLPPGNVLIIRGNNVEFRQYWDLEFGVPTTDSEQRLVETLYELLSDAVKAHLISDVPLGAFQSGGLDSSSIVAVMSQVTKKPIVTCSIGFREKEYNELGYARTIANRFSTRHYEYPVEPQALDVLNNLAWHYDEPFGDSSAIPTYYVSKMARQNVTVALSGDGGDENFAGYRRYFYDRFENDLRRRIPKFLRTYLIGTIAGLYPKADWAPRVLRGKMLLTNLSSEPDFAYYNSVTCFKGEEKTRLLKQDVVKALGGYDSYTVFEQYFNRAGTQDPLSRVQYLDLKTYLADDILTKVDRASMAVSLEVRPALLDHKLVEFVTAIPSHLKLNAKNGKYILKRAMESHLPSLTINRRKMGFAVPLDRWFRNEIKELVLGTLMDRHAGINTWFDPAVIKRIWDQHQAAIKDNSAKLWVLLMFEMWHKRFL